MKKTFIVIADDDEDDHYFIRQAIMESSCDAHVTSVYNGRQLIEHLKVSDQLPDMIIIDLNMPVMNGFGALENISSNPRFKSIPVFILTTSNNSLDISESRRLGCVEFYTKPQNAGDFTYVITDMIRKSDTSRNS
jgi:CheY-like chemotaxis protein